MSRIPRSSRTCSGVWRDGRAGIGRAMNRAEGHEVRVGVELGDRSYDIAIASGLLAQAGERLRPLLRRPMTAIVTDENVAGLHLDRLRDSLRSADIASTAVIVPPGEGTKSYEQLARVCDELLAAGIERRDVIIALGGGVIGD